MTIVFPAAYLMIAAVSAAGEHGRLHARFIGNAAVEITDGEATLLTDFPYRSGAFGYMAYDSSDLRPRAHSICLFTHAHADHFEPALVERVGCTVVGPAALESSLPPRVRRIPLAEKTNAGPLSITPISTEHGPDHDSYRVEWNGIILYFTGDTESTGELARAGTVDVLFVTPWLLSKARHEHALPSAGLLVVIHHRAAEKVPGCIPRSCVTPRQGETLELARGRP